MSGVKRRTAYRKAVADAVSDTYPVPTKDERVVQVLRSHGSNLLEVGLRPAGCSNGAYDRSVASLCIATFRRDSRIGDLSAQVTTASGDVGICMMPTKYRKLIWVSRGDYLIASEASADVETADGSSGTVRFFVEHILREPQIGVLQMKGLW
jgi:probable RNA-binding protein EIF1AD